MKILPTKVLDSFFTEEEFRYMKSLPFLYSEINDGTFYDPIFKFRPDIQEKLPRSLVRRYLAFNDNPQFPDVNRILKNAVQKHFGPNLYIGASHILTAFYPYLAHSDAVYGEFGIDDKHYGAYTLIIPLDNFESNTVIFNEYSEKTKVVNVYAEGREPIYKIDDEFYNRYLTHEAKECMNHLSVETVYPWRANTCLAMSRYKFHGSDDFFSHGIPYKQAVIMWTYSPY